MYFTTRGINATELQKDQFKGERVFGIGTGPSIKAIDPDRIAGEYIWGSGLSYQLPFDFDFYSVTEQMRLREVEKNIREWDIPKFYNRHWQADEMEELYNYDNDVAPPEWKTTEARHVGIDTVPQFGFAPDLEWVCHMPEASIVSAVVQPAVWLGFTEIYLLGCDFSGTYSNGKSRVVHAPKWIEANLNNFTKYMDEHYPDITVKNLSAPWDDPKFGDSLLMEYGTLEEVLG